MVTIKGSPRGFQRPKPEHPRSRLNPEQWWHREVLRLFHVLGVRAWVPGLFPELKGKFLTGKRRLVHIDWERRLLIGSLGWDEQKAYRRVPMDRKMSALTRIQEKIGQACLDQGSHWRIIIHPLFAEDQAFNWLWFRPPPATASPVPAPARLPIGPARRVSEVPYYLTRPLFPLEAWPTPDKPYVQAVGEGKFLKVEALSQLPRNPRRGGPTIKRMPYGILPIHILDTLFNVSQVTHSPLIAFWSVRELMELFGYADGPRNRARLAETLWDLLNLSIKIVDPLFRSAFDLSPFEACALWVDRPVKIDRLGRRNQGRPKADPNTETPLFSTYILLSETFLEWCRQQRLYDLDWALSNDLKGSPKQWLLYRKAIEWGGRSKPDRVPLGGPHGLLVELGYRVETAPAFRVAKCRFRKLLEHLRQLTKNRYGKPFACPHVLKGDQLLFFPWEPLRQHKSVRPLPVPRATRFYGKHPWHPSQVTEIQSRAIRQRRSQLNLEECHAV